MKFTIFNYSSPAFLQPIYFKAECDKLKSCEMILLNSSNNVYHVYDTVKPDYSIINIGMNLDLFRHYNDNSETKISHILNLDYLNDNSISDVQEMLKQDTLLNCVLLFSGNRKHKNVKFGLPYVYVPNSADVNIPKSKTFFDIDIGIVINSDKDKKEYQNTYHFITIGNEQVHADINVNNISAARIFCNYKTIIFRNMNVDIVPETFFNAIYFGNMVYFDNDNEADSKQLTEVIQRIFDTDASFNFKDQQHYDVTAIRDKIFHKHSSKNRFKTLLSQLKNTHNIITEMGE